MYQSIPYQSKSDDKKRHYSEVMDRVKALITNEDDWVSAMATVVCELHHSFDYYHWTGFYRVVSNQVLKIGPYQGGHGCLMIPFSKGVCGAAAKNKSTQMVDDVNAFPGHIACAASTQSEIVVPILNSQGETVAVFDVDSDLPKAFCSADQGGLEELAKVLSRQFFS